MPRAGSTTRAVLDCMVILSRERRRGPEGNTFLPPPFSDPSIRFDMRAKPGQDKNKVCRVVLKVSRGSRPAQERRAGWRAHERSIMVFAALVQLKSSSRSTRRSVGKLACAEANIQPSIRFLATANLTFLAAGLRRQAWEPPVPLALLDLNPIAAWVDPGECRR